MGMIWKSITALSVFFDKTGTDFVSEDVENVIKEIGSTAAVSASPGFSFGRSGVSGAGTFLNRVGSVPSNKAGITVNLENGFVSNISVANENVSTFGITLWLHDGDFVSPTSVGTVNVINARSAEFSVNFPVTKGRQIAIEITSGSAKNLGVDLQIKGATE